MVNQPSIAAAVVSASGAYLCFGWSVLVAVVRWRQSLSAVHTWLGLLCGWWLFFMFVTGTLGYLDVQLDAWLQPELHEQRDVSPQQALPVLQQHLMQQQASEWRVHFPYEQQRPFYEAYWRSDERHSVVLQQQNEQWRLTDMPDWGGQWLYQLHYRFHYLSRDIARVLACALSAWLLLVLISGVVVHKKILQEMLLLRLDKGLRTWLDGHNVLAVTALPFFLLMAYSGLLFYGTSAWPAAVQGGYGFSDDAHSLYFDDVRSQVPQAPPVAPEDGIGLLKLYELAMQHWGVGQLKSIRIDWLNGMAHLTRVERSIVRGGELAYVDMATGQWQAQEDGKSALQTLQQGLFGLHEGLFAGPVLRALYLLAGVMGCILIASGHVIWLRKRERRRDPWWHVVRVLNVASFAGLPAAIAIFMLLQRSGLSGLDHAQDALFLSWLLLALAAIRIAPSWLYGLAAGLWLAVAIIDWWLQPLASWQAIVQGNGDWLTLQLMAWSIAMMLVAITVWQRRTTMQGVKS